MLYVLADLHQRHATISTCASLAHAIAPEASNHESRVIAGPAHMHAKLIQVMREPESS